MPKGDHIGRKRALSPTPLLEVDATPAELGRFLRDKCDLVIMGETHFFSGAEDAQLAIANELNLKEAFVESSPSDKATLNDPRKQLRDNWGKEGDRLRDLVLQRGGTIFPVDIEHDSNAESLELLTKAARAVGGTERQLNVAFSFAAGEASRHGRDVFRHMPTTYSGGDPAAARKFIEEVLAKDGDVISRPNQNNLLRALDELEFSRRTDVWASVQRIGKILVPEKLESSQKLLETRNRAMADGIDSVLRVPEKGSRAIASVFQVGSKHNEEVEDLLEARGYRVANVKVELVANPDLNGKVYWNPDPAGKDDAEWVVTAYEPHAFPLPQYSMPGNQRCQKPTEIPKAKLVLEGIEK